MALKDLTIHILLVDFVAFYAVSVNGFNGATCNDP